MVVDKKNEHSTENEDGQAIFEFIIFLPFFIFFFTIMITIGNAINGSINQQKATRRYFYYLIKGNSRAPDLTDLDAFANLNLVGQSSVGWREKSKNKTSFGTCYRFQTLFSGDEGETCDEPLDGENRSRFVRVFTFYGICGDSYQRVGSHFRNEPRLRGMDSCVKSDRSN